MSWLDKLKERWNLQNIRQVIVVLIVFACTGFTVLFIKRPLLSYLTNDAGSTTASIIYYVLILPFYNLLLLFYGMLFGQLRFFWEFEKRFFRRLFSIFKRRP